MSQLVGVAPGSSLSEEVGRLGKARPKEFISHLGMTHVKLRNYFHKNKN